MLVNVLVLIFVLICFIGLVLVYGLEIASFIYIITIISHIKLNKLWKKKQN